MRAEWGPNGNPHDHLISLSNEMTQLSCDLEEWIRNAAEPKLTTEEVLRQANGQAPLNNFVKCKLCGKKRYLPGADERRNSNTPPTPLDLRRKSVRPQSSAL